MNKLIDNVNDSGYTKDILFRSSIMSTVAKWGNTLAVRLPKSIQSAAKLNEGDQVDFVIAENGDILIKPLSRKKRLELMLSKVTPENLHAETDWGQPVGGEVW